MKIDIKNISGETVARTIILALALANQFLTVAGKNPIPVSDDEIYGVVTAVATIGVSVWSWWKNNSITKEAIQADQYKDKLKNAA